MTDDLQEQQAQTLRQEIAELERRRHELLKEQALAMQQLVQEALRDLEQRKQALQTAIEQLERRQERMRAEMRSNFAGVSQDLVIRVQGFKEYLVGSLQELVSAAEELPLAQVEVPPPAPPAAPEAASAPRFSESSFQDQGKLIRRLLDQYRHQPDYYGPPWQLRRTFEPVHAERVSTWFFTLGGRGALKSTGSRLQNILITSAIISVLRELYGSSQRTLILVSSPERMGEWRRGVQDCLGLVRTDFGSDRGVAVFDDPDLLALKAERLEQEGLMPLVVIDETENQVSLSLLRFSLWLAFAPDPQSSSQSQGFDYF